MSIEARVTAVEAEQVRLRWYVPLAVFLGSALGDVAGQALGLHGPDLAAAFVGAFPVGVAAFFVGHVR